MKKINEHKKINRIQRHTSLIPIEDFGFNVLQRPFGFGLFRTLREPELDITEKGDRVIVKTEVPEMEEKDIKVHLDGNLLTISGERSRKREIKKKDYYYREERASAIQQTTRFPEGIKKESKTVHYKNGILTVGFLKKKAKKEY